MGKAQGKAPFPLPSPEEIWPGLGTKPALTWRERGHTGMAEKRIMVVDDDESIRTTFRLLLQKQYRVLLARDSEEALREFKSLKFDLIIADLRLPRLSGLEVIARFRDLGYDGEAILISAHPDCISIDELSRHAIGHFFSKPLDLTVLSRSIEYLLQTEEGGASARERSGCG